MSNGMIEILDSAVDWVTITSITGPMCEHLLGVGRTIAREYYQPNMEPKVWAAMGYRGWAWTDIKMGVRGGREAILICSGRMADDLIQHYALPPDRATRIDIQLTVAFDEPNPDYAMSIYRDYAGLTGTSKYDKVLRYISSATGDTLYIGKRGNNSVLRIYDKGGESGIAQIGTMWRFEMEYRRDAAKIVQSRLNTVESVPEYILGQITSEMYKRKVVASWKPMGSISAIEVGAKIATVPGQLQWLGRCVSPIVVKLINQGHDEAVLSALKLKHLMKGN